MRRLPALATVLVLSFALAYGLNAALGKPGDDGPTAFIPRDSPGAQPSPPVGPPPDDPGYGDWSLPGLLGAVTSELTDRVQVAGKSVRLPPGTEVETGSQSAGPCSLEEYEVVVRVVVTGQTALSWVQFTPGGELLSLRVEPDVAPKLQALLSALPGTPRPTVGPYPNCVVMKGKVIWLPEGVLLGSLLNEEPIEGTPSVPDLQEVVTYNKSRIVFTRDGVLYQAQSIIADEDRDALAPLLSELAAK